MTSALAQPRKPATYADLERVPAHLVGELIDGDLHLSPRPSVLHARVTTVLSGDLHGPFGRGTGGPGGWILLIEPELRLGGSSGGADVIVPDLAGWRRERMPELPDAPAIAVAPDWVCEVLSPSTEAHDRSRKLPLYARERISNVWLVDPAIRTLEVYRLDGPGYRLVTTVAGEQRIRAEPFEATELDLAELWAR
jgi:Uma2 family endonuclease